VDSLRYLQTVGESVQQEFLRSRSLLSFQQYLDAFLEAPRAQARSSAQYLRDCIDHFGVEEVQRPSGPARRFRLFDRPWETGEGLAQGESGIPVRGQEEAQNALYRALSNFVRLGRVNKLLLLHGPNGSAKSSMVSALFGGLECYSHTEAGALYRFNWIFPSEKLVKGSIGFGDEKQGKPTLPSFAWLEAEQVDARITCELRCHPLWLLPRGERAKLLEEACKPGQEFTLSRALLEGDLCHRCRQIHGALLQASQGNVLEVLRYVQVERFFLSRRYLSAAVTVEPQMSVDAEYRQVTQDKSHGALPSSLHNLTLFEPYGPLVSANRGLLEFSDLLKRPIETYKYLLGTVETGQVRLQHFVMALDCVLLASSNEKHLAAFKELPDWPSFKGRIELLRVPYLRQAKEEERVYQQGLDGAIGKHLAPHAVRLAANWAVLTRLKRPMPERYKGEAKKLIEKLTPLEKLELYDDGRVPDRYDSRAAKELRRALPELWAESDAYPNYEGRLGASAREMKTVLDNAAQLAEHACLTPGAVLEELGRLTQDKSVYEFLEQEVVDGYHDHTGFLRVAEGVWLDELDEEVREAMGLVSEKQYRELFERYIVHVVGWTRGEKLLNKVTGDFERPDEEMMSRTEAIVMAAGEDRREFRRQLISTIGAHRLDHPDAELDYARIFPDVFRRLRDHYFEERRRTLRKLAEKVLRYLGDERSLLLPKEVQQVEATLQRMRERYGYCEGCAKEALVALIGKRYAE
jgi:serine protein kinase